jgi:DNA-binding NarL/FixJ family response regulator
VRGRPHDVVTDTLQIVIAVDDPLTRASIRRAVANDPRLSVCAEASDAAGAVDAAMEHQPDICLLDIEMPGNGIAAAWEITARLPQTAVVMLTASDSDVNLFAALRAGASGYLIKDTIGRRLSHTLLGVARGEAALPRALVTRVIAQFRDTAPPWRRLLDNGGRRLTSREWQILKLTGEGLTTNQIARRLSLTPATVRSHRAHIIRKLREADAEAVDTQADSEQRFGSRVK